MRGRRGMRDFWRGFLKRTLYSLCSFLKARMGFGVGIAGFVLRWAEQEVTSSVLLVSVWCWSSAAVSHAGEGSRLVLLRWWAVLTYNFSWVSSCSNGAQFLEVEVFWRREGCTQFLLPRFLYWAICFRVLKKLSSMSRSLIVQNQSMDTVSVYAWS